MRVLVATDQWFPDFQGGSARVAAETARRLAGRGHLVTVLAPRHEGAASESSDGPLTVLRILPRGRLPQTLSDVAHTRRWARRLGPAAFDVLLAHQSTTAVGLSSARLRAPLVYVYHASGPRELRFRRSRLPYGWRRAAAHLLEPPLALLERVALRRTSRILILSEFSRSLLQADYPSTVPLALRVPGGVDVDRFSPGDGMEAARTRLGLEPGPPLLLSVRRLAPRMGLEELLQAAGRLGRWRQIRLAIVGGGPLEAALRRLAGELELDDCVRFVGRVSDDDLRDWYRAADLFVLPTVAYEGFGMATVEALASGLPVVGTPVGATPELLRPLEPRLVAAAAEPTALASAIEDALALSGPSLRRRCREYACARFSWEKAISAWEQAIAVVVGNPPP